MDAYNDPQYFEIEEETNSVFGDRDEEEIEEKIVREYTKPPIVKEKGTFSLSQTSIVLDGEDEEDLEQIHTVRSVTAFRHSYLLEVLFWLLCLFSLFILLLIVRWWPFIKLYLTHWRVRPSQLYRATTLLIKSKVSGELSICPIKDVTFYINRKAVTLRIYVYRNATYIYNKKANSFSRVSFNCNFSFPHIHSTMKQPIANIVRNIRTVLFGRNEIVVPMKSVLQLLMDEVLHPFYLFQVFSCVLWMADGYYVYATAIIIASTISAILSLIETRANLKKLRSMAKFKCNVKRATKVPTISYKRDSQTIEFTFKTVDSSALVPGDIIQIEDGVILPCDIMLISGQCIVNEAMLTGESIPIVKNAIPPQGHSNETYSIDSHKNHTLYSGTQVVQTRLLGGTHVLGICVRTGFDTSKGKLMLSILYPKPTHFKFYQDSLKFIGIMMICGLVGIAYSAYRLHKMDVHYSEIILRALDVITIAVPPALPVAMTVGLGFAISRLKEKKIYCISPPRVNLSGKISCMCFDKTGTLTEEGLDLYGVRCVSRTDANPAFDDLIAADDLLSRLCIVGEETDGSRIADDNKTIFLYAMASCHSLTFVKDELVGDPLEQKIFQSTQWVLKEPKAAQETTKELAIPTIVHPPNNSKNEQENIDELENLIGNLPLELGILRRFDFSSSLQRMSVIVKNLQSSEMFVFVKGSPEAIGKLCHKETLPADYDSILYEYAHQGYRVLACGYKKMKSNFDWRKTQRVKREEMECDLVFLGLIIMQNRLKKDTPHVIQQLTKSNIECIMVTGDNAHTAMSVARQCGIISDPTTKIFFGELRGTSEEDQRIYWKDMESDLTLDPVTLLPSDGVQIGKYELAITGPVFEFMLTEHNRIMRERDEIEAQRKLEKRKKPKGWDKYFTTFQRALIMCHIYARMSPDQKLILSEQLQALDYYVGFCGDGANDCGALKGSHVGISLSEAEASIAAPFTSLRSTIKCVPSVMIEGRAALQTSFQCFKFISCYSFIQFFTVILLYEINSQLGDYQFLFVDMGIILPIVLLMSKTRANRKLVKEKPLGSLINRIVFLSLFGQLFWSFFLQFFTLWVLRRQPFYSPLIPKPSTKENIYCLETTTLFLTSAFHTLSVAAVYSISKPFKRPLYTNKSYTILLSALFLVMVYLILIPDYYSRYWLELRSLPFYFRFLLLSICLLHLLVAVLFERIVIAGPGKKLVKMVSFRRIKALVIFVKNYLTNKISKNSKKSRIVNQKLLRSRKRYNKIKKIFFEDYYILRLIRSQQ
jgi:cation-transporting ATPase 13A2